MENASYAMLLYCNRNYLRVIVTCWGSVFWNVSSLSRGLTLAAATAVLQYLSDVGSEWAPKLAHHYGMHALGVIVGFACVFRNNLSWSRYWEAVTQLHFMYSKWADAYSQIFAFASVTIQRALATRTPEGTAKAIRVERTLSNLLRNFTLMSAIAADRLAHGDTQRMERRAEMGVGWTQLLARREDLRQPDVTEANKLPKFTVHKLARERDRQERKITNEWCDMSYQIKAIPSKDELAALADSTDRPSVVMYWIIHDLAGLSLDIDIAPPIQSRIYQELSNGMLGFSQAQKIADIPFPFPYAQLLSILVTAFALFIPAYITVFTDSAIAGPILAFLLFQGIWGINESAIELENPFGPDVNDVTLVDFHNRFVDFCEEVLRGHKAKMKKPAIPKSHLIGLQEVNMPRDDDDVSSDACASSHHGELDVDRILNDEGSSSPSDHCSGKRKVDEVSASSESVQHGSAPL